VRPRGNLPGQPKQRGGRRSREKGNRAERAIVAFLQDSGFAAQRVPLSGSAGGKYVGDVTIPLLGRDMCAEVKVRAYGFGQLYAWLDGREILIVRQDRREPLVILPLRLAAEIAGHAERNLQESRPVGELARLLLAQAIEPRADEH
jgi:Holliday junction resolvase